MPLPIAASTIAAQAFRFLELSPISSFADDTPQARDASEQYPLALASCLSACDWSFASVLASLAQVIPGPTVAPDATLPYLYALPGDVVTLREVGDFNTRWRRDREGLRADQAAPLVIRYTGSIENEAALPATFQTAVALALAVLLAPRWLETQSKAEALKADAARLLKQAMREDARMASEARYDGTPDQGDWVAEARW